MFDSKIMIVTRWLSLAVLLAGLIAAMLFVPVFQTRADATDVQVNQETTVVEDDVAPDEPPAPRRLSFDEAALAVMLARVSFNEALGHEPDLALIWQVIRGRAQTTRGRIAFLRRHSRCVTGALSDGQAAQRRGNCWWSRNLTTTGSQPAGWDPERNGPWDRTMPRWLAHLELAFAYVRAGDSPPMEPCAETPWTWDGRRYAERWEARGLRPVECSETTRNAGLVRIPRAERLAARRQGRRSAR